MPDSGVYQPLAGTSTVPLCLINKKEHFDLIVGSRSEPPVVQPDGIILHLGRKSPGTPHQLLTTSEDIDVNSFFFLKLNGMIGMFAYRYTPTKTKSLFMKGVVA